MTSYLALYLAHGVDLFSQNAANLKLSPFGVLPHEIAALNAGAASRRRISTAKRPHERAVLPRRWWGQVPVSN